MAELADVVHVVQGTPVCFTDRFENLVFAPLVIHLQLLREADARQSIPRGRLLRVDRRRVSLVVERLMALALLVVHLVLGKLRGHTAERIVRRFEAARVLIAESRRDVLANR